MKTYSSKHLLLAFILGFAAAYAFAPTYAIALLPLSFSGLAYLLFNAQTTRQAFATGWAFGFGYFLRGMYWICYALLVDGDMFAWLIPFAITLIPSVLALYIGAFTALLSKLKIKDTAWFTLAFIGLWVLVEIVRARLLTGFPWLTLGYSMTHLTAFIQSGSIVGVFGISVIVLSASLIPFLLMNKRGMLALVIVCIISTNYLFGWLRLRSNPTTFTTHKVRIVQPNILQENKWSRQRQVDNLMRVIELSFITPVILSDPSHGEGSRRIQAKNIISLDPSPSFATQRTAQDDGVVVVWPESATGIFSLSYQSTREFIAQSMPKGSLLAAGSTRVIDGSSRVSMFLMNAEAEVLDIYDKVHLVPFGEYVPLRQWIPFNVKKITHGFSDFLPGKSHKVIKVGTFPGFRPLICYESFFANEILPQEGYPEALINITNDSWYGDSPGPHQHLDISIFRAVEYGVPMIRAANTGMSAITDSYGRTLRKLELNTSGVLDAVIAKPVPNRTLYSLHGDTITLVICIALIGLSFRSNLRKHS